MNLSAARVYMRRHKSAPLHIIAGLLLLVIGWQFGRITSPYYAAHPIVFEEAAPSQEDVEKEIVSLREEGSAQAATSDTKTTTPTPAVAGTTTTQGEFVGSRNSNKYHHTSCNTWRSIKEENRIWFTSIEDAESRGYSPTQCTAKLLAQ